MRLRLGMLILWLGVALAWRYQCELCACCFDKRKSYEAHLLGKRHAASLDDEEDVWREYQRSGMWYSPAVPRSEATRAFSLDRFVEGLPGRTRSSTGRVLGAGESGQLDPGLVIQALSDDKRAALFRYCSGLGARAGRGPTPPALALTAMLNVLDPRYCRVKEILESAETYTHIARLLAHRRVSRVFDVGCGHGLVGMLCAAAMPAVHVHSVDLSPRSSFEAQREAFIRSGTPLHNLSFECGGLDVLERWRRQSDCLLICVHGCNELTPDAIGLAQACNWAWLALPCCLRADASAPLAHATLGLPDETRHALLCGALASEHRVDSVRAIDSRITARSIVLASAGGPGSSDTTTVTAQRRRRGGGLPAPPLVPSHGVPS